MAKQPKRNMRPVPAAVVNFRKDAADLHDAAEGFRKSLEDYANNTAGPDDFSPALSVALKHTKKALEELDKLRLSLLAAAGASVMGDGAVEEQAQLGEGARGET